MNAAESFTPHWHERPVATPLTPGEVHIWLLDLEAPLPPANWPLDENLLDANERQRAARLKLPADRDYFIRRRMLARHLLAGVLDTTPSEIVWSIGSRGRLHLDSAPVDFNWSHSGSLFLFAVTAVGRVGADIERWRNDLDLIALAESALSQSEVDYLRSLPSAERSAAFWSAWTAHEATAKAHGAGIAEPSVSATTTPCQIAQRVANHGWTASVAWLKEMPTDAGPSLAT